MVALSFSSLATLLIRADDKLATDQIRLIDKNGGVEETHQFFANDMEFRCRFPACTHLTAARQTMALAANFHIL